MIWNSFLFLAIFHNQCCRLPTGSTRSQTTYPHVHFVSLIFLLHLCYCVLYHGVKQRVYALWKICHHGLSPMWNLTGYHLFTFRQFAMLVAPNHASESATLVMQLACLISMNAILPVCPILVPIRDKHFREEGNELRLRLPCFLTLAELWYTFEPINIGHLFCFSFDTVLIHSKVYQIHFWYTHKSIKYTLIHSKVYQINFDTLKSI